MTDFLYPDILNEQLTYARQARAAWLWTNVAERSRIFLQVLDTLQPSAHPLPVTASKRRATVFLRTGCS